LLMVEIINLMFVQIQPPRALWACGGLPRVPSMG
jgi:hypothetical protein